MSSRVCRFAAVVIALYLSVGLNAQTGAASASNTAANIGNVGNSNSIGDGTSPAVDLTQVSPSGDGPAHPAGETTPPLLFGISGGGSLELGQKVTLLVSISSSTSLEGLTFQWRRNGSNIAGATANSYLIDAATVNDAGTYTIAVTNAAGTSVASTDLSIKAASAPVITAQPSARTVVVGQSTIFSFVATGSYPRTYQWRRDGNVISGATAATYTIAAVTTGDAASYSVIITNSLGSVTSLGASLSVNAATPPVLFASAPSDVSYTVGQQASLSSFINSGSSPFSYQWMKNGVELPNGTSASYTFTAITLTDAGRYSVKVTNVAGSAISREATITVNPAIAPSVSSQPTPSQTLYVGQTLSLTVSLSGSSPITYQWKKNDVAIAGATSGSFYVSAVTLSDGGSYTVLATNPAGSVTSNVAVVNVSAPVAPTITTQPLAQNVAFGSSLSLSVAVSGTPPFAYLWKKDGVELSGGTTSTTTTSSSFFVSSPTPANNGSYTVTVFNATGSVTSNAVAVTIAGAKAPAITTQPVARTVTAGSSVSLSVGYSSTGTGSLAVQWLRNGVPVANARSSSLSFNPVKESDAGDYTVLITGDGGAVLSTPARLVVLPPDPPLVSSWPSSITALPGSSPTFSPNISRTGGTAVYQWFKDGVLLPAATADSLRFSSVQESDYGSYQMVITGEGGVVASPPFTLSPDAATLRAAIPWISATQVGNVVYFLAASPGRIERYDLTTERWLPTTLLSETQVPTAFLPLSEGVYIAYGRTLVRRTPDLSTETAVLNVAANITNMFAVDDFLFYSSVSTSTIENLSGNATSSLRRSTLAPGPANPGAFYQVAVAPGMHRAFGPNASTLAVGYVTVATDGIFSASKYMSNPGQIPLGYRTFVTPGEQYVINSGGSLFRAGDLAYAGSIGASFSDLAFLGDSTPVVLRGYALSLLGGANYIETGRSNIPFRASRLFALESSVFAFGAPTAVGGSFSVAKVARSAFTSASSAPAVSVAFGERFSIDGVFTGSDGVVGILSRSKQAILRWSPARRAYLNPLRLRDVPLFAAQSFGSTRVLLAYADGAVSEVVLDSAAAATERVIGQVGNRVMAITDLNDMIALNLRASNSISSDFRVTMGNSGQTLATDLSPNNDSYFSGWGGVAWNAPTRRLYWAAAPASTGSTSVYYDVVPPSGALVVGLPMKDSTTVFLPLRFNAEGTLLVAGNGRILNTDLRQVGALANSITDATWTSNALFTLWVDNDGQAQAQRWARLTYLQSGSLALPGAPLRVVAVNDSQLLAVTRVQGFLNFTLFTPDLALVGPAGSGDLRGIYFGKIGASGTGGDFALYVRDNRTGVLLVHLASPRAELVATNVSIGVNGSFYENVRDLSSGVTRLVVGSVGDNAVTASIPSLSLALTGTRSATGSAFAGFYQATAINGGSGTAYAIVAGDGRALFASQTSTFTDGGLGTFDPSGKVSLTSATGAKFNLALSDGGGLSAKAEAGAFAALTFGGLRDGVARTDRLANISTRGRAGVGDDVMIAGFVLSGSAPRPVLIRAIGPALGAFGVPGTLADPRLALYRGDTKLAENDNWSADSAAGEIAATTTRVGGFALTSGSADAALLVTLNPGAYTAQVSAPANSTAGNALVEVYDSGPAPASGAAEPRLINIATRGRIAAAGDTLIAGIVVTGNSPKRILIRAVGPGLAAFGVPGTLVDPLLTLTGATATGTGTLATNDDWGTPASGGATAPEISATAVGAGAFALPPGSKDACLLLTLQPGNYTAQVTGKNNGAGVALIEVYEVNN
jgi:hypothetical protein